jgi:hypothetical protein
MWNFKKSSKMWNCFCFWVLYVFGKYQTCMVFDSVPTLLPFLIDFSLKKEERIKKKKKKNPCEISQSAEL